MSKLALVTGGNKGIGFETARQLAQAGVHVLLAARTKEKADAAAAKLQAEGLPVTPQILDVTNEVSIAAAATVIAAKYPALDILINNAGVMNDDPAKKPSEQSLAVWRSTFDTNVFGVIAVTNAFLPLLRKAPAARIVNLSSILGSLTLHSTPDSPIHGFLVAAYNVSKTALNGWTVQLAQELAATTIKVNAAHPGHVQTDMGGANAPMAIVDGAKTSVQLALLGADGPTGGYFHMGERLPW
jgi:NAD(P)-dependent dehydrogenase (short-subunit alcohol dehydrogenase family)